MGLRSLLDLTESACLLWSHLSISERCSCPRHLSSPTRPNTWALMDLSWPWEDPQHPIPCHPQPYTRGGMASKLTPCRLGSDPRGSLALIPCVDLCCLQTHADPGRCPEVFGRPAFWLISPSGPELALSLAGRTCILGKMGLSHSFPLSIELGRGGKTSSSLQTSTEQSSSAITYPALRDIACLGMDFVPRKGHHHLHWVSTELSAFLALQMWSTTPITHFW